MTTELNPLDIRIQELMELTAATHQDTPDWYRRLCIEKYIREEEPELLQYKPTEPENKLEPDNENVIKIPYNIENKDEAS